LGGGENFNVHFLLQEINGHLGFLFDYFMNQKANGKVEDKNDSIKDSSHHHHFKNIGFDVWNPFV